MGLLPLEYTDCLTDSPHYRENVRCHEKELDRMSQATKGLIKEVKDLLSASKGLSRAQRSLAGTLINFKFDCIGCSQTDDEIVVAGSLKEFGRLLLVIEDERDRLLERAQRTLIDPIENFRKENIGAAKEGKKKFEKETARFCQSLERHLNLSTKKGENHLQEADACLEMEQRHFFQASLDYASLLTRIQEKKKFEFVETILSFMQGMMTFYHQGYEVAMEFKPFMDDLQRRLQRTRENFEATHNEAEQLKQRTLEKAQDPGTLNKMYTRQGYLYLMEKKALGCAWTKHFCQYQKSQKKFSVMPYSQTVGKIMNGETVTVKECIGRKYDTIDKRFCFDVVPEDKAVVFTFQALSDDDKKLWLDAMGGKETSQSGPGKNSKQDEFLLDEAGFIFVHWCINFIESRGLTDQGLYRLVGVNSKVSKLLQLALDKTKSPVFNLDEEEWDIKTVTSALKSYFRNLPEPLLTFRLHNAFIASSKQENKTARVNSIHTLVHSLAHANLQMLELLIGHLSKITKLADKNLMTVSNLGVCFGPTLLRPEEETVAAVMDIKFGNIVVEILIENCTKIFASAPEAESPRRQVQPPPYVSPPAPSFQANRRENHRSPVSLTTAKSPDVCSYRNSHLPASVTSNQAIYSVKPNNVSGEQACRPGLVMYNPMWSDNSSCGSSVETSSARTGPPPRPPLPPDSVRNNNGHSIHNRSDSGTMLPHSIMDEPVPRDFYLPQSSDILPDCVKVRTVYACQGENDMELSFEPNEIIYNVQPSQEPGWIHGTLNGKSGLIPVNYVVYLS